MPPKHRDPLHGGSGPGSDDFSLAAEKSGLAIPHLVVRRQEADRRRRRQRLVERLHRLGARVVFELLDEIARHHGIEADIDARLARYAAIDPTMLACVGGDQFAVAPLRAVGSGR